MKKEKSLRCYAIISSIFTVVLGTLLHFTYQWSGNNEFVALFSAVNESTWEHLKLLFMPMFIFTLWEYTKLSPRYDNYLISKVLGILAGLISIPLLFYGYTAILGTNYLLLDILTFILSVLIAHIVSYRLLAHGCFSGTEGKIIGVILLLSLAIAFFWFTYFPPNLTLFAIPS